MDFVFLYFFWSCQIQLTSDVLGDVLVIEWHMNVVELALCQRLEWKLNFSPVSNVVEIVERVKCFQDVRVRKDAFALKIEQHVE